MIVNPPEYERRDGTIRISARIESSALGRKLPPVLWVDYPESLGIDTAHDPSDAFVAALLLVSMSVGEDLEVRGSISRRFAYGLERYQEIFHLWFPDNFRRIRVKAALAPPRESKSGTGVVCQAFSGGVDSFYTLRGHLPTGEEIPLAVTHAMMVHGFDVPLTDPAFFARMKSVYAPLLADLGVTLIPVATNVRQVTGGQVDWEQSHGSALAFVGLASGAALRSFIISSTCTYDEGIHWGSDPRTDHWLSSESTEVLHYGADRQRSDKLSDLCDWPPIRQGLRVCWEKPAGIENCCRCGKCLRTMMILKIKGRLEKFPTFPLPFDRELAMRLPYNSQILVRSAEILIELADKEGSDEVATDLRGALRRQKCEDLANKLRRWFGRKAV